MLKLYLETPPRPVPFNMKLNFESILSVCSVWTITEFPSLYLSDNDEVCWTIWGNFVNNADDIRVDDAGGGDELGYSRHIPNSVFDIGALWYNWYLDLPSKFLNFFNNVCFSPLSSQLSFPKGPGAWKTPSQGVYGRSMD